MSNISKVRLKEPIRYYLTLIIYQKNFAVNAKFNFADILNGHLGAILALLYGLSAYKQQIKQSIRAAVVTQPSTSDVNCPSSSLKEAYKGETTYKAISMPPSSK
ncbi:unnamed protein product [Thelazia callipaeda]|uniref:Uncharacterized protein n=1 Tax=Thelazia callipaeda TaxID=103827 RepID=A0A0N5D823_THECL|nr:unnamed protein product [Thelazia callipaeda]